MSPETPVIPDLLDALKVDRRRVRSEVALHAARVLVVQPEQFADMVLRDVLLRVPYVSHERRLALTADAGTDLALYGGELSQDQRLALARHLARFAKGPA